MDISDNIEKVEQSLNEVKLETRQAFGKVDGRLSRIEALLPTFATKADLQEAKAELIKWLVGTAIGLGAAAITVMTFVLNNATPRSTAAPVPIIIQMPAAAAAPPLPPTVAPGNN